MSINCCAVPKVIRPLLLCGPAGPDNELEGPLKTFKQAFLFKIRTGIHEVAHAPLINLVLRQC